MNQKQVVELEWQKGTERLSIKTAGHMQSGTATVSAPPLQAIAGEPAGESKPKKSDPDKLADNEKEILSPFVGTFYRAPSPGTAPFVIENQAVKPGEVLCIIEAMKLMNEIESEYAGKVSSILVENGQPVEYGQPLFIIST